jgi:hypothetical protein
MTLIARFNINFGFYSRKRFDSHSKHMTKVLQERVLKYMPIAINIENMASTGAPHSSKVESAKTNTPPKRNTYHQHSATFR